MPKAEQILWDQLKGRQFEGLKFRRQHGIGRYVVDFYCPALRLVIELDGGSHFEEGAKEYDELRQSEIEQLGIEFIRFRNDWVYSNLEEVMGLLKKKIEAALEEMESCLENSTALG